MPTLSTVTLHEAALLLGVTYNHLSRSWRGLGWAPVATKGRVLLFPTYAVEEWWLSYQLKDQGSYTLRWLPWGTPALTQVLGRRPFSLYDRSRPPYYSARHRESRKWIRRYNPLEIKDWANVYGYHVNFLAGFTGVARRAWEQYLQATAGDGPGRARPELVPSLGTDGRAPSEEKVG